MSAQIRFVCPTCKANMTAPVERAGKKINCLKCGQRLQIPPAERAKTILAASLGVEDDAPVGGNKSPPTTHIAASPSPPLSPSTPSAPPLPNETQGTQPNLTVPRGWILPAKKWLLIAICASSLNGCADLVSICSGIESAAGNRRGPAALFGLRHQGQESAVAASVLAGAASVLLMVIWLGVHWLLIWRRVNDLGLPVYRVWTGLHIGWTALALIGLLFSLYKLSFLFEVQAAFGGDGSLGISILTIILNLLADVGWVMVVIATPTRQDASFSDGLTSASVAPTRKADSPSKPPQVAAGKPVSAQASPPTLPKQAEFIDVDLVTLNRSRKKGHSGWMLFGMGSGILALLIIVVAVLLGWIGPANDQKALQGKWNVVSWLEDGKEETARELRDVKLTMVFQDNKFIFESFNLEHNQTVTSEATFAVDPSKTPKEIDITLKKEGKKLCIYELKGDDLKICMPGGKNERPTHFKAANDRILTLKRIGK